MAEWFKAAVLKTVERKLRGFESYSLRHYYGQANSYGNRLKIIAIQLSVARGEVTERLKVLAC